MTVNIYQIITNDMQYSAFNEGKKVPSIEVKRALMFGASKFTPDMFKFFTIVAKVDTDNLERAFELTNLWDEPAKVEVYSKMTSTSVGDIFQKGDRYFMVDNFGFQELYLFADELEAF